MDGLMPNEEAHLEVAQHQALATEQQQQGQQQQVQHRCRPACCPPLAQPEYHSRKCHLLSAYLLRWLLGPALLQVLKPAAGEYSHESPAERSSAGGQLG